MTSRLLGLGAALLALALLIAPDRALAHRVNVYAYAQDGRIVGEAYFSSGAKARQSRIEIQDASGAVLAETETDAEGAFSLPAPAAAPPLTVVLKAGEGHQSSFVLKDAVPAGGAVPSMDASASPDPAVSAAAASASSPAATPAGSVAMSREELEQVVAKAVSERLAPLSAQIAGLAERQDKVALRDVIGGLGWIAGIFGAAVWFGRRRRG